MVSSLSYSVLFPNDVCLLVREEWDNNGFSQVDVVASEKQVLLRGENAFPAVSYQEVAQCTCPGGFHGVRGFESKKKLDFFYLFFF